MAAVFMYIRFKSENSGGAMVAFRTIQYSNWNILRQNLIPLKTVSYQKNQSINCIDEMGQRSTVRSNENG